MLLKAGMIQCTQPNARTVFIGLSMEKIMGVERRINSIEFDNEIGKFLAVFSFYLHKLNDYFVEEYHLGFLIIENCDDADFSELDPVNNQESISNDIFERNKEKFIDVEHAVYVFLSSHEYGDKEAHNYRIYFRAKIDTNLIIVKSCSDVLIAEDINPGVTLSKQFPPFVNEVGYV